MSNLCIEKLIFTGNWTKTAQASENVIFYSLCMHHCITTPKCTLTSSEYFKNNVKVVKHFEQMLNPGDVIDFQMKVNCGPGIKRKYNSSWHHIHIYIGNSGFRL